MVFNPTNAPNLEILALYKVERSEIRDGWDQLRSLSSGDQRNKKHEILASVR